MKNLVLNVIQEQEQFHSKAVNVFKIYVLNITQNGEFPFIHILETKLKPTLDKSLVSKLDLLILVQLNIVHLLLLSSGLIFQNDLIDLKYLNEFRKNGNVGMYSGMPTSLGKLHQHFCIPQFL